MFVLPPEVVTVLLSWGTPGLIIIALLWALRQAIQRYDTVQEARIKKGEEYGALASNVVAALQAADRNQAMLLTELQISRSINSAMHAIPVKQGA